MNNLILENQLLFCILIPLILVIIILLIIAKPWFKFICWSKTDEYGEDDIRYNIFNKTYYYCYNDHYGCIWKDKMTNSQLKEYDLIENKSLKSKENKNEVKIKQKMENSKSSLLLKILKQCFLIIIIILTYKIGVVIIEIVPNLVKNQLTTTINK